MGLVRRSRIRTYVYGDEHLVLEAHTPCEIGRPPQHPGGPALQMVGRRLVNGFPVAQVRHGAQIAEAEGLVLESALVQRPC